MRIHGVVGISLLLCVLPLSVFGQTFTGEVVEVRDGDTLVFSRGGEHVTVHLHGLDAPEPTQAYGSRASTFVRRRALHEEARVGVVDRDRSGDPVARVFVDGGELNAELLRAGLAWYYWWYDEYTPAAAQDQRLEYRAQRADRGLWKQSSPIPPWEWRDSRQGVAYATSGPTGLLYNPSGRPRRCEDFPGRASAQRFFDAALPSVGAALDSDRDGRACEEFFAN